ncbi:MAG: tetratricopeptide repeat protein [Candidatus Marinimicrobia bacterium]|jgi:tetratricopeptide (TPR) repeat protein|nr:tetratricopeptide repeat protein [Candidatus Neomarinimicrobiota bacterium]MDP6593752.1 tetratricopeptide repeat protein [Candidatus Neomarinimicrobiota bacterium]MDP6837059.1 tetratricopeptide repeat protein [Candidatus Neomarinimicrobiota bacterium]MDP6966792.1 tetratricopeptide repeat protein [Candidatus Neomarinimicrobiota bacterium]|tara:strand:+ start:1162 stop:1854 length:693 start_codon:yes stop_codon:yes gene_type:complete
MLKPKRKMTKKEIRHDPLLETVHRAQQFHAENRKLINYVGAGLAAVAVIGLIAFSTGSSSNNEARGVMARALVNYQGEDYATAVTDFDILINDYPGSTAGNEAQYYLGQSLLMQENEEEAKKSLEDYIASADNSFLAAGAFRTIGDLSFKSEQYEEAAGYFEKAASVSTVPTVSNQNLISAALAWIKAGEYKKAGKSLDAIRQDVGEFNIQAQVDEVTAMLDILSSNVEN